MKDAYSFDADVAQLNKSYDAMYEAYCRIFDRCGLPYVIVEAESGPIGGDASHEFMVPCSTGEDTVIQCTACGYAANQERAEVGADHLPADTPDPAAPAVRVGRRRPTSGRSSEVCEFLKVEESTLGQAAGLPRRRQAGRRRSCAATTRPTRPRSAGRSAPRRSCRPTPRRSRRRPARRWASSGRSRSRSRWSIDRAIAAMRDGRRRRQRRRRPPDGRRPRPRFPARPRLRPAQRRRRRPLPALRQPCWRTRPGSRSATSSSSARSTPRRWGRPTSTRRGPRSRIIMGCYGIGINRIMAGGRRGRPRRQRHRLAAVARALPGGCSSRSRCNNPAVMETTATARESSSRRPGSTC